MSCGEETSNTSDSGVLSQDEIDAIMNPAADEYYSSGNVDAPRAAVEKIRAGIKEPEMDVKPRIVKMIPFHCKKGAKYCEKCAAAAADGPKFHLIEIGGDGVSASPMIDWDGVQVEFVVRKLFVRDEDAYAYAKEQGLKIID